MDLTVVWQFLAASTPTTALVATIAVWWRIQVLIDNQVRATKDQVKAISDDAAKQRDELNAVKIKLAKLMRIHATRHAEDALSLYDEEKKP